MDMTIICVWMLFLYFHINFSRETGMGDRLLQKMIYVEKQAVDDVVLYWSP